MTLGGSRFPGVLGSMPIEVLPFLRGIVSKIQSRLGDENLSLLPTVFVGYALTSILVGAVCTILGVFRCGRLVKQQMSSREYQILLVTQVRYFPKTVLTGAIGG